MKTNNLMKSTYQKTILRYVIVGFLFLAIGVIAYVDDLMDHHDRIILDFISNAILIGLPLFWLIRINDRLIGKVIRVSIIFLVLFLLAWILIRVIKFRFFMENATATRYLWYAYYIPQIFVPMLMLVSAAHIGKSNQEPFNKKWYLLLIPAITLSILIMTNDLHQWGFKFKTFFSDKTGAYSYGWLYFLITGLQIGLVLFSFGIVVKKCCISECKKRMWIPIMVIIIGIISIGIIVFVTSRIYKIAEIICMTYACFLESCIFIGLFPSNTNYEAYFKFSGLNAVIVNKNNEIIYNTIDANYSKEFLLRIQEEDKIDGKLKWESKSIRGGKIIWADDLTSLNDLNQKIADIKDGLLGENELIKAENESQEQKQSIKAATELYDEIETQVNQQTLEILALTKKAKSTDKDIYSSLGEIGVLGAYIKRRSNLSIISKHQSFFQISEIGFCIKESLDYLRLLGIKCAYSESGKGIVLCALGLAIYDGFQSFLEGLIKENGKMLMVHLIVSENKATLRLIVENELSFTHFNRIFFNLFQCSFYEFEQDDVFYLDIIFEIGGIL